LYTNAKIKAEYKPEFDVINDFMNDSTKVIVTSKKLTDAQIQYLRDTLVVARTTTFAYDALALVTNKENLDSLMKYNTVRDIFLGKIKNWNEINPKSSLVKYGLSLTTPSRAIYGISRTSLILKIRWDPTSLRFTVIRRSLTLFQGIRMPWV